MPRWEIRGAESPVTFSPANRTVPWLGSSMPVIRLNSVDFPAPFGPMTARTSPSATRIDTWSTATSPPKRRVSSSSSSNATISFRFGPAATKAGTNQAPDPLRRKHHESDEDKPKEQGPGLGVIAQLVLNDQKESSAENRADQCAGAADDHHDQDLARQQPEQQLGVRESGKRRIERAGQGPEAIR